MWFNPTDRKDKVNICCLLSLILDFFLHFWFLLHIIDISGTWYVLYYMKAMLLIMNYVKTIFVESCWWIIAVMFVSVNWMELPCDHVFSGTVGSWVSPSLEIFNRVPPYIVGRLPGRRAVYWGWCLAWERGWCSGGSERWRVAVYNVATHWIAYTGCRVQVQTSNSSQTLNSARVTPTYLWGNFKLGDTKTTVNIEWDFQLLAMFLNYRHLYQIEVE